MQKLLRILGSIFAAIVLGAIGSGLWEKVLSPLLSKASSVTVALISQISSTYEDSVYQRAAKDVSDLYAVKIAFLIFMFAGFVLVALVGSRFLANANISDRLRARLHLLIGLNALTVGLTLLFVSLFSVAKIDTSAQVKERSLRSIEILRPSVGEVEYVRLRARYYSMNSKADFLSFRDATVAHARNAGVTIPLTELAETK